MVKIRLKRLGRKKRPFFRIVVIDSREKRQGVPLAELGFYNPLSRELKLDKKSAESWVGKGAIASAAAARLIEKAPESGELIVLEKAKKERLSKKALSRQQEAEVAAAQKATEEAAPKAEEPVPSEEPAPSAEPVEATAEEVPAE